MSYTEKLVETAAQLVESGRGILAADESTPTIKKRFDSIGVESTAETRRAYREMLFTTRGAPEFISGVILYDETLRQSTASGKPFPKVLADHRMIPGIKVDLGAKALPGAPGETITEGLDGLRDRLAEYRELGAGFAKWRAVIKITDTLPSAYGIDVNAHALARYAALCQEQGLVPIVEPEVLMDGPHTLARCEEVTHEVLAAVFSDLHRQRVMLEGMLLKPNMVISGTECADRAGIREVAQATVRTLSRVVPGAVPGIVFLSGGQSDEEATAHLNAMNMMDVRHPWELSFSYGRALQAAPLRAWGGKPEAVGAAQAAFLEQARNNGKARYGLWEAAA